MAFLTDTNFKLQASVPLALPETEMRVRSCETIACVRLEAGMSMEVRWLGLHVISVDSGMWQLPTLSPVDLSINSKEVPALDALFVGIYFGATPDVPVTGVPLFKVGSDTVGFVTGNPSFPAEFNVPGYYSVVAVNNSLYDTFSASVSGVMRVQLTPDYAP